MPPATRSTRCVGAPAATTAAQIGVVDDSFHGGGGEVRHDLLLLDGRTAADLLDPPRWRALPPAEVMGDLPGGVLGGRRGGALDGSRGGQPAARRRQEGRRWR